MKVYLTIVKESGILGSTYEVFDSLEKAVKDLKEGAKEYSREIRETEYRNEFAVYTESGEYVHTLRIIDVWVR